MNFCQRIPLLLILLVASPAGAASFDFSSPDFDRWNYPFNATPGSRSAAPVFGAIGAPGFDDFDGQFLVGFDTSTLALPVLGAGQQYRVSSAVVKATHFQGAFPYDPTNDPSASYLDPGDANYVADADAGRPILLFGAGLRGDFTAFTFGLESATEYAESSDFGSNGPTPGPDTGDRSAFAADALGVDVSTNIRNGLELAPLAVGQSTSELAPGDPVLEGVPGTSAGETFEFDIDVDDQDVQNYLLSGLSDGLFFNIASLHSAAQQAGGTNPVFYTSDNFDPAAIPPTLSLTVDVVSIPEPSALALAAITFLGFFAWRE